MTTAFELRRHLAADHDIRMSGADYATLLAAHADEHVPGVDQGHTHTHDGEAR